jgi:hypothetical protein
MPVDKSKIISLRLHHPCLPSAQIAERVGASRQYINQVLQRAGVVTHHTFIPKKYCPDCGVEIHYSSTRCQTCYEKCHDISIVCDECGTLFTRKRCYVIYHRHEHFFCSRHCRSVWRGKNVGFGAHPEHMYRSILKKEDQQHGMDRTQTT